MDQKNSGTIAEINPRDSGSNSDSPIERRRNVRHRKGDGDASNHDQQSQDGHLLSSVPEIEVARQHHGLNFSIYNGDSCLVTKGIPSNSVHFQVMSPPFSDLFCYSDSPQDLGNCTNDEEFFAHYSFLVEEQFRISMPGRLCALHVMQLPTSKTKHGVIGLRDFRGEVIRLFQSKGWILHSEVCIWKNPVTAMQRTKALGLLHKTIRKDSSMSRQGVADYLVVMRKPGENQERIGNTPAEFPVEMWQRYASPVWATADKFDDEGFLIFNDVRGNDEADHEGGIDQSDTLQARSAREDQDEKHLCCLQKGVIRRAIRMWSNPGDVVASWFAGIGSEGVISLEQGRRFVGVELKPSYYKQACANLEAAEASSAVPDLFPELA